jgi:uncharacterized coiled-coil protein SlyX
LSVKHSLIGHRTPCYWVLFIVLLNIEHRIVEVEHRMVEVEHRMVEVEHQIVEVEHLIVEVEHRIVELLAKVTDSNRHTLIFTDRKGDEILDY